MLDAIFIYSDAFQNYQFSPDHPFNPHRLQATRDLIQNANRLPPESLVVPFRATLEELMLAHSPHYIDLVERLSAVGRATPGVQRLGLGTEDNPVFLGMHEAASLAVGASLEAARAIVADKTKRALNLSGGLHHAGHGHAAGFCIYNDVVTAIRWIRRQTGWRILYLETDAHHGDGVQDAFYKDGDVLVLSFHESGHFLFPGSGDITELGQGEGYGRTINIPLAPATDDASWLYAVRAVVPPVLEQFRPQLIVSQHGCDGHYWDPLADLCATTHFYQVLPQLISQWADHYCDGRWLATGGGGYQALRVVPRAWTLLWAHLSRHPISDDTLIPSSWLSQWQPSGVGPLPQTFIDSPEDFHPIPNLHRIQETNIKTLQALSRLLPELGIKA